MCDVAFSHTSFTPLPSSIPFTIIKAQALILLLVNLLKQYSHAAGIL